MYIHNYILVFKLQSLKEIDCEDLKSLNPIRDPNLIILKITTLASNENNTEPSCFKRRR